MTIAPEWFDRLQTQRRNLTGRTGCGLCGAETIEQALEAGLAVFGGATFAGALVPVVRPPSVGTTTQGSG